jgi:hypothetical protein
MSTRANAKDNSKRRFNGGHVTQFSNPDSRKTEADERQKAWAGLTPIQQLKELDRRLGEGKGAARQRARIMKPKKVVVEAKTDEAFKKFGEKASVQAEQTERVKAKDRHASERKDRPSK